MTTITQPRYAPTSAMRRPVSPAQQLSSVHLRPVAPVRAVQPTTAKLRSIFTTRTITVLVLAFAAIFVGRLFLSVGIDANAYAIAAKAKESQNLSRDAQFIQEQLNVLDSPQHLSSVAAKLGMISNTRPAYLRISDGKVWGNPHVAATGRIDRTNIANALESTVVSDTTRKGVASVEKTSDAQQSVKQTVAATPTKPATQAGGIPAPNTH